MFFLRNGIKLINPMLKNKRVFSNCNNNNNCCNLDIETKKKNTANVHNVTLFVCDNIWYLGVNYSINA